MFKALCVICGESLKIGSMDIMANCVTTEHLWYVSGEMGGFEWQYKIVEVISRFMLICQ